MQGENLRPLSQLVGGCSLLLILAACSTAPMHPTSTAAKPTSIAAKASNGLVLPPSNTRRGGYYKDDGPADQIPPGLENLPDAEPRVEPYSLRANRPYSVFGNTYIPITDNRSFTQRGIGSWYGKKFHGKKTSSGELYDMYKMTAAHPTLPIPSYSRVTNLVNGKQIIVRINDRGPFHSDRIIDLSYTAALKLGYIGKGSGLLEVEHLSPQEIERLAQARRTAEPSLAAAILTDRLAENSTTQYPPLPETLLEEKNKPLQNPQLAGYYLQLGAFTQGQNAEAMRAVFALDWANKLPPAEVEQNGVHYRLVVGPFATREKAAAAAQMVQESGTAKPIVVAR